MGIQVCFGKNVCFSPAIGQLLYLNGKEEVLEAQYSYMWPLLARSEHSGFYEVLIHGQLCLCVYFAKCCNEIFIFCQICLPEALWEGRAGQPPVGLGYIGCLWVWRHSLLKGDSGSSWRRRSWKTWAAAGWLPSSTPGFPWQFSGEFFRVKAEVLSGLVLSRFSSTYL